MWDCKPAESKLLGFLKNRSDFFPNVFAAEPRVDFSNAKSISSVFKSRNKDEKIKSDVVKKPPKNI